MKKRKQLPRDMNERAKAIVELATDETAPEQDVPGRIPPLWSWVGLVA